VAYRAKAKFSLGKVASKYLILEMLSYAGGASKYILWEGNRSYRTLLSENLRFVKQIGFNFKRLPIVEFPQEGQIIIPSTCDY
jgi:xylose isomerase